MSEEKETTLGPNPMATLFTLKKIRWNGILLDTRIASGLSILGGLLYLVQSFIYAHSQASLLDEGAYLVKGFLFATGKYELYQDYGPWTNHMPLAFLIPGYVQLILGPGLRTGRYLAVALSLLILLGIWVVVRRLGGRWWAVLAVWSLALNPAVIKLYSLANSQSLLACMFVWTMVLVLGDGRPLWQLLAGSALAGLMMMTRVNLAPVVLLVVAFILWAYGWRAGLLAALAGFIPVLAIHTLYWPGILRIWAHWIPADLVPFLQPFAHPPGSDPTWNPVVTLDSRVTSFFHGFRFHFVALVGAVGVLLLWAGRKNWKSLLQYKTAVFLAVLLVSMFVFHMWAALGNNYCVFCFPVYLSFFTFLGLFLLVVSFHAWARNLPAWRKGLVLLAILLLSTGLGYSAFAEIGDRFLPLLDLQVPRMGSMRILPGMVPLSGLMENRFGMESLALVQLARRILPALAGLITGLGLLAVARFATRRIARRRPDSGVPFATLAMLSFLALGYLLSPTIVLGGGYNTYDCTGDVIHGYELAGEHLARLIPPGSRVYWHGGNSAVPLLYLDDVEIYPAQINGGYSLRKGGDPDALARYGFWSEELAHRWAAEADFILIEERLFRGWLGELVEAGGYNELRETPTTVLCRGNASIHIYKKSR